MNDTSMRYSIRLRWWLAVSLPALLVIVTLFWVFADRQSRELERLIGERARATAQQVASSAEFALFAGDTQSLQRLVRAISMTDPDVLGVGVLPLDGQFVVSEGRMPDEETGVVDAVTLNWSDTLVVRAPVFLSALGGGDPFSETATATPLDGKRQLQGHVVLVMDLKLLATRQKDLMIWSVGLSVFVLLLSGVMSHFMAGSITGPMVSISRMVDSIGQGVFHQRLDVSEAGPLKRLAVGINEMADRIDALKADLQMQVAAATEELRQQKEAAEQLVRVDALTGVGSRRAFTERAELELQRALRYQQPLCVVMIDLDRFKRVNDSHGHAVGDSVLVTFARAIQGQVREVDMVGRLGGEEFSVLLPGIGAEEAVQVAERMRLAVENRELLVGGQPLRFTASFGVAEFDGIQLNLAGLLARADAALYHAKRTGRNKVVFADDTIPKFKDSQFL